MNKIISFIKDRNKIGIITLNNPPVNALSKQMLSKFHKIIDKLKNDSDLRVIIILSNLKDYCAGADLKEREYMNQAETKANVKAIRNLFNKIESLPCPIICAITGHALGGGAELTLAADFRIGDKDTKIGFPEGSLGIIPGAGGTKRLSRIIGISKAKYWIYTAQIFSGKDALNDGVLDILSDKNIKVESILLAKKFIKNAPLSLKYSKISINKGFNKTLIQGMKIEEISYNKILESTDRDEGLNAYKKKQKPHWNGK